MRHATHAGNLDRAIGVVVLAAIGTPLATLAAGLILSVAILLVF